MDSEEGEYQCSDCGATFTFTAGEQEFYAVKGFTNEPGRCPSCRQARRAQRNGFGSFGGSRYSRQMFSAVCAECGIETQVPFEPRNGRPVYCSRCYDEVRMNK